MRGCLPLCCILALLLPIFLLCIEILIHKINKIIDVLFQSGKMKAETK
ncbi:hypothetical protein BRLA_c037960 [Brevibacillus laterosporus LMG 15441]|uniref:Uncharacterized protein n=1 Tax=Brevibacillus laterosporus LMG 15441 TaxID=1042163 RepID=A0A075R9M9_BRELA|nr:hypothetical protein BRLA_c037960 [Brevibacillus laterosporus LMG 15441]ERM16431.1 hypothetical protein P615_04195 [Brevibacillus laterosporus PE36]